MTYRRPLIAGNWKMNGGLKTNAALLAELTAGMAELGLSQSAAATAVGVAVCVPAPYLAQVRTVLQGSPVAWGAQDVSAHASGAYTGEVAVDMLREFDCSYVIVGHSERRSFHAETDSVVAQKTLRALSAGLTPIVCVGETLAERQSEQTEAVVGRQLAAVLAVLDAATLARIVLAYEPVWAIGTGVTATPQMAQQVHAFLRAELALVDASAAARVAILYGGSMKPENAAELLAMDDIDGGLIGGAALKSADFLSIISAAANAV